MTCIPSALSCNTVFTNMALHIAMIWWSSPHDVCHFYYNCSPLRVSASGIIIQSFCLR